MNKCVYGSKCKECKYVLFRDCPQFRRTHGTLLIKDLIPFKYKKHKSKVKEINYSSDLDLLKSVCADYTVNLNVKLRKFNLNQTIDLVLTSEDIVIPKVIFIEITQKPYGEAEKVKNVFMSFVDRCLLNNRTLFIYSSVPGFYQKEWNKLNA